MTSLKNNTKNVPKTTRDLEQQKMLRVLRLVRFISEQPRNTLECAEIAECTRKTVYEYINLFKNTGFPIKKDAHHRYYFEHDQVTQQLAHVIHDDEQLRCPRCGSNWVKSVSTTKGIHWSKCVECKGLFKTNYDYGQEPDCTISGSGQISFRKMFLQRNRIDIDNMFFALKIKPNGVYLELSDNGYKIIQPQGGGFAFQRDEILTNAIRLCFGEIKKGDVKHFKLKRVNIRELKMEEFDFNTISKKYGNNKGTGIAFISIGKNNTVSFSIESVRLIGLQSQDKILFLKDENEMHLCITEKETGVPVRYNEGNSHAFISRAAVCNFIKQQFDIEKTGKLYLTLTDKQKDGHPLFKITK